MKETKVRHNKTLLTGSLIIKATSPQSPHYKNGFLINEVWQAVLPYVDLVQARLSSVKLFYH